MAAKVFIVGEAVIPGDRDIFTSWFAQAIRTVLPTQPPVNFTATTIVIAKIYLERFIMNEVNICTKVCAKLQCIIFQKTILRKYITEGFVRSGFIIGKIGQCNGVLRVFLFTAFVAAGALIKR